MIMGTKKKDKKAAKPEKGAAKPAKAAKADKPGTAKYEYPKDCVTDADKKKYRSLMRSGKDWPGAAGADKKTKKKDAPAAAAPDKKKKKKEKASED